MTTFGEVREQVASRVPPDAVVVPAMAFSPEWAERPLEDVCLGLRPVPSRDLEDAQKDAADAASRLYPRANEGEPFFSLFVNHYRDMLLRTIVSRGTCDPNDVTQPWDGWRVDPDELARTHLTAEGTQFIFDAWERMKIANNPSRTPATDDDVEELIERIHSVDQLESGRAMRIRRLLAFCLSELKSLEQSTET